MHCTRYNLHCTRYNMHCTRYNLHCTRYNFSTAILKSRDHKQHYRLALFSYKIMPEENKSLNQPYNYNSINFLHSHEGCHTYNCHHWSYPLNTSHQIFMMACNNNRNKIIPQIFKKLQYIILRV
jgi:hypothetical protein